MRSSANVEIEPHVIHATLILTRFILNVAGYFLLMQFEALSGITMIYEMPILMFFLSEVLPIKLTH